MDDRGEQVFSRSTRIERPAAEVSAWHERPGALARLCPPWERVEILEQIGGVRDGARVCVRNRVGPVWMQWTVEHRDYVAGVQFRDVQVSGPFARWEHLHRFEPEGADACRLVDEIRYRLPFGATGRVFGGRMVRRRLERLFRWRHAVTKADVELASRYGAVRSRRIVIAGASGLIGRNLTALLETQGHPAVRLVRGASAGPGEIAWDPARGELDPAALAGVDAVINLSGENVGAGRWTAARRERIWRSRVETTRTLVRAIVATTSRPAVLVNASAVGVYGSCGDAVVAEDAPPGGGFLADVCAAWEREAVAAEALGVRVARLRFGVVLTPAGGALAKLLPVFRAGLGGRVGNGRQWMSWVSVDDAVGALYHAVVSEACDGPVNVVAPEAVTNAAFTKVLARVLRRPAALPVSAAALRMALGQMADETLLASTRAVPQRLVETGYGFRQPTIEAALRHVVGR